MKNWWRAMQLRIIIKKVRKYASEGVEYDPDRRIYSWRWTEDLEYALFRGKR
ncbi:MAG: hypothetical protein PHN80_06230 [Hespellia sp.]|nr:hypothetical protein [Hespellia sp.]